MKLTTNDCRENISGVISMIIRSNFVQYSEIHIPNGGGNKQESNIVYQEVLERAIGLVALFETLYLL